MPVIADERRIDVKLERGLRLVTLVGLDDDRRVTLRLGQELGRRMVYQTPRILLPPQIGARLRRGEECDRLTIAIERLASPVTIEIVGEELRLGWCGAVHVGKARDLAEAIAPPVPVKEVDPRGSDDPLWCLAKPPLSDETVLSIGDGVGLAIESRTTALYAGIRKGDDIGSSAPLTPNLDLRSPTRYTWLSQGNVAVRLVSEDRLTVYRRGVRMGTVSLNLLRATIHEMGGRLISQLG